MIASKTISTTSLALMLCVVTSSPSRAADVTLKMKGGSFEVSGLLRAFDGQRYVLETKDFGNLTLDAARFECVGDPCQSRNALPASPADRLTPGKPDTFTISGDDAIPRGLLPSLAQTFASNISATAISALRAEPDAFRIELADTTRKDIAYVDFHRQNRDKAIASLIDGTAHFALSDRGFSADEAKQLTTQNERFRTTENEHVLAVDVVALIAHPTLPIDALNQDAIARILSGQAKDWVEVGLPPGPITVHARLDGAAAAFTDNLLRPRNLVWSTATKPAEHERDVTTEVADNPFAIGVTSLARSQGTKPIGIDMGCGLVRRPSIFAAKVGEYPFVQRLMVLTSGAPLSPSARGFLRYLTSNDVQPAIRAQNYVDRLPETAPPREVLLRLAEIASAPSKAFDLALVRELQTDWKTTKRLSVTFRFQPGSNDLDTRSRSELARLVENLGDPAFANKSLLFAGFANAGGLSDQATAAALKRAAQVRLQVLQALGPTRAATRQITPKSYGHIAPVLCPDASDGSAFNRRVEVWVKD